MLICCIARSSSRRSSRRCRVSPDPTVRAACRSTPARPARRRNVRKVTRRTSTSSGDRARLGLKSAPNIRARFRSGEASSRDATPTRKRTTWRCAAAGAMPGHDEVHRGTDRGSTLGSDFVAPGLMASLVGLGLSVLFMIAYYKLRTPGGARAGPQHGDRAGSHRGAPTPRCRFRMAGLVLSVAMAVDANVLIFERIREELRKNKTVASAIEAATRTTSRRSWIRTSRHVRRYRIALLRTGRSEVSR